MDNRMVFLIITVLIQLFHPLIEAFPLGCDGNIDLVFLVDCSNSLLELSPYGEPLYAWRKHQSFMKKVVQELPVGRRARGRDSRVGLVTYASDPKLVFHFAEHETSINIQDAISAADFQGGNTNSAAALRVVRETSTLQARSGSKRVVVLFSDGLANVQAQHTQQEAEKLRAAGGTEVFVIAVSREININVLQMMASEPHEKYIINIEDMEELTDSMVALTLLHRMCDMDDPLPTTPTPEPCLPGCALCEEREEELEEELGEELCMECMQGYYLNNQNQCQACMDHCQVCEDIEECTVCNVGWYWEPDTASCEECAVKADIVFVIDSSSSIQASNPKDRSYDNYNLLKDFINLIIDRLDINPDATRIGAVKFSTTSSLVFHLDDYDSAEEMQESIRAMAYDGELTNTAGGLQLMREELFQKQRGDRPDVRNVGIVITDGESNVNRNETQVQGQRARDNGIVLFVLGATKYINVEELKGIASDPDEEHYFESAEIRYLDSIMNTLIKHVCTPENND